MNSLVPSSGSTRKNSCADPGMRPAATSSSATTGIAGRRLRQALEDDRLGRVIRRGHRRSVLLVLDLEGAAVDLALGPAGLDGGRDHGFKKRRVVRHVVAIP